LNDGFYRPRPDGIDLFVRLTPKSSRDAVEGVATAADGNTHLRARVRAAPEDGQANAALERLVAGWLGLPRRGVTIVGGSTARLKTVRVTGAPEALAERLAGLAAN